MAQYCDEFLVHGVDVEGKSSGVEGELVELLGRWEGIPVTYAGGIGSMKELEKFKNLDMESWILRSEVHWICLEGQFLIKICSVCK